MKPVPGITTVIVSCGMEPMADACLVHLRRAATFRREMSGDHVVLVDNATPLPMNRELFEARGVETLRFDVPQSFAAACNAGMRRRPNNFFLMLNNDVFLREEAIDDMLQLMASAPRVGICGARLVYPNGSIQHAGIRMGPENVGPYHVHRGDPSIKVTREETEFQAVTGACILIRRETMDELSGFDESYPFGWEDIDFCLRARQAGWRVMSAQAHDSIHMESMTPGRMDRDPPSKDHFMDRWRGKWCVDG